MSHSIACFRCGASLSAMSLPIARQDLCPECGVELLERWRSERRALGIVLPQDL